MTGVFQKARLVVLGNVHELLDKRIDMNSIPVLKQYVRDLEDGLDKLSLEAATAAGRVRTLTREKSELEHQAQTSEETIKRILQSTAPDKDAVAKQEAVKLAALRARVATADQSLQDQTATAKQLEDARQAAVSKHNTILSRLQQLQQLDASAKAKEQAAAAVQGFSKMAAAGVDTSVDDIESRIRARSDVADEKLNRALDGANLHDPATDAEADSILADIKSKLG